MLTVQIEASETQRAAVCLKAFLIPNAHEAGARYGQEFLLMSTAADGDKPAQHETKQPIVACQLVLLPAF